MKVLSARDVMRRSAMWFAISSAWLYLVWAKLERLRALGVPFTPLLYLMVAFWALVLLFWAVNLWRDWHRLHLEAAGKVS